jgi:hypothetical protein
LSEGQLGQLALPEYQVIRVFRVQQDLLVILVPLEQQGLLALLVFREQQDLLVILVLLEQQDRLALLVLRVQQDLLEILENKEFEVLQGLKE